MFLRTKTIILRKLHHQNFVIPTSDKTQYVFVITLDPQSTINYYKYLKKQTHT